ncbi:Anthocyanidin 5,3-O-glucosyltransferase [Morus notabilis]|uniref:Anthocyanidin 5,3-O-glucosyltransferase n=1 Tax=Morus notabilis TaxID=981085 RepID=W9RAX2_9ROSA|nr:UDP-glycosyltransferase 88F5 [Morus notabilis]EXB62493.1 Anthocyanidin 5,3-O-glucosyltransferase [Morus notabilis]
MMIIKKQKEKDSRAKKDAIVLYPSPGIGHVVSMVELGKLILSHSSHRFTITILLTTGFMDSPALANYINRISHSHPAISFLRFPFQHVDAASTHSHAATRFDFVRLNRPNVAQALKDISESSAVRAVVIDIFCASALDVAMNMGIPTYYFFTSGAAVLAAFLYFPKIHDQTTKSFKDMDGVVLYFPGMPPLNSPHMPEPMLDRDDAAYWDMVYFCSYLPKSVGILVNTFDGLEPIPIEALANGVCVPEGPTPPVYCIGPLIDEARDKMESSNETSADCLAWLDAQPSRSVVFLCFGSRGSFSALQIREIANGLERSGQRFLWVVKKPPSDEKTKQTEELGDDFEWESLFPEGFLERTKERGMVVRSWAPQVAGLRKEAVGGFVTHCGWNSVLEAVVAGVPMVAWPLYAEQHMNRNVMVKDLGIAVGVEQREGDGFVSGDEVERRVRELIDSEHGKEIRHESLKMKDMASAALGESGSSVALQKFVGSIITKA